MGLKLFKGLFNSDASEKAVDKVKDQSPAEAKPIIEVVHRINAIVAVIDSRSGDQIHKETGYRLCTVKWQKKKTGIEIVGVEAKDVSAKDLAQVGLGLVMTNAKYDAGEHKVVGTNGVLDRYARIIIGADGYQTANKTVVMAKLNDGFLLVDGTGKRVVAATEKDVVAKCKHMGIANGKVVSKDGKEFISAIRGEYPRIDMSVGAVRKFSN